MLKLEIIGSDRVDAAFRTLGQQVDNLIPLWPSVRDVFYQREKELFSNQGEGAWAPLSPRYRVWKEKHFPGQPLLVLHGDLKESLTGVKSPWSIYEERPHQLDIGTAVRYAYFHARGAPRANLPKRPPIIIDNATEVRMLRTITDYFHGTSTALGFGVRRGQ